MATGDLTIQLSRLVRQVEQDLRDAQRSNGLDEQLSQAAVAWVLGTLFVRFAEDNGLISRPPAAPTMDGNYSWLLSRFEAFAEVDPGTGLFERGQNLVFDYPVSEEAAGHLVAFWDRRGGQGEPAHDLADPDLDTRLLGDLYQDVAERARKQYALLQTPVFVTDFILDLTLEPAIEDCGHEAIRLIDPVCGSGNFLLEAFARLLSAWRGSAPTAAVEDLVGRALRTVHGVDLNPFAVAITRFRLLIAAVHACGAKNLRDVTHLDWRFNIAVADSLIDDPFTGEYDVVVGNPPYTTVRDKAVDKIYRARYDACTGKYALTVPFAQRFFQLARPGGYVGQITSNSFMKREFGRKLVEDFFPRRVTLTHIIDTAGAFIPGHGTPTVVLVGRNQPPRDTEPVLTVVSLRGEPTVPVDPAQAHVWRSLMQQTARPGQADTWTASRYVSRENLSAFPLLLATDEATDVLNEIARAPRRLGDQVVRIGYFANTGSDDLFTAPRHTFARSGIPFDEALVGVISGSEVRDWNAVADRYAFFPYDSEGQIIPLGAHPRHQRRLWPHRTVLRNRPHSQDNSYASSGRPWYGWHQLAGRRGTQERLITYSWVATHNHFAALHGDEVPLHSAPVMELPPAATARRRTDLVGMLNSSTVCFWLKHGSNSKGRPDVDQTGTGEHWDAFYEFTATRLRDLPLPEELHTKYAGELDQLARELAAATPEAVLADQAPTRAALAAARARWETARARLVALQEELDWEVYFRYGVMQDEDLLSPASAIPLLGLGERAFEIVMARKVAAGELNTAWFARHGTKPVTDLPAHWPVAYREVVLRRIDAVQRDARLRALERPEFKRRWISLSWDLLESAALRTWLLDRFERADLWYDDEDEVRRARPLTITRLAELLGTDRTIRQAAELYTPGKPLVDVVRDLLPDEMVPYLAAMRYRDSGMAKRAAWEQTWRLQREEDALLRNDPLNANGEPIPQPPRYSSGDFLKASYWRHRGKYDVPSERFISYPRMGGTVRDALIGWAGWSVEDRARVLADLASAGRDRDDIVPLLAGLLEVLPWVKQWCTEQEYNTFRTFLDDSMHRWDITEHDLNSWRPPKSKRGRPRKQR
ncbi:BREX-2 system adenine-specific DNA-methyltransferase PglX [Micromonospora sp. IBSANI012]|uniref:BREX-2 system adenine-specific DNA-methyltransferase PglX n=1 Tax=Micromonospora sp. IBSANI012 TaxID=3457761 RepID=UPI0040592782